MTSSISCNDCGYDFPDFAEANAVTPEGRKLACPQCGSPARHVQAARGTTIQMRSQVSAKARHEGVAKPFSETRTGADLHRDTGEWRHLDRKVDRENDWYDEIITNADGDVVHEQHHPLSEHRGHGSDKARP